jgi:hypothetical protein
MIYRTNSINQFLDVIVHKSANKGCSSRDVNTDPNGSGKLKFSESFPPSINPYQVHIESTFESNKRPCSLLTHRKGKYSMDYLISPPPRLARIG